MAQKSRKKHRALDPVFKQVLVDELGAYQATLQTEVEIARLPRRIDAVLTIATAEERQKVSTETPFFYCLKHNLIEFKGRKDRLTKAGYHTIDGRKHFLISEGKIPAFALTVTIICASKPQTVFTYAQKLERPFTAVAQGYYKRSGTPPVYLIVINELPIVSPNYPLLLFAASEDKFREFLEQVIIEGDTTYIRYAYEVRPQVTREVLTMAGISSTISRKDLEFMAEDIGPELVPFLDPEDIIKGMNEEKQVRLASINLEALLKGSGLEKLYAEMSPASRKKLIDALLKLQSAMPVSHQENN